MKTPKTHGNNAVDATESSASARRKFLKQSSGAAMAAPAVVLLLAAESKSAQAGNTYKGPNTFEPPKSPGKNLLDP